MSDHVFRHNLDCDSATYWKCVFDPEYNRRLYLEVLKFREFKVLEQKEDDRTIKRRIYLNPPAQDLPGPIAKVVGDLSWVEEGTYEKATHKYTFKIIPASQAEKSNIHGEVHTEDRGPKKAERIAKNHIEVKIFMIGGLIEKKIY